jgi:hypothetical protein
MSFVYFLISYPHCAIAMLVLAGAFAFLNSKINLIGNQLDAFDELYENDADMIDRCTERLENYTRHAHRRINNLVRRNRRVTVERVKTNSPAGGSERCWSELCDCWICRPQREE